MNWSWNSACNQYLRKVITGRDPMKAREYRKGPCAWSLRGHRAKFVSASVHFYPSCCSASRSVHEWEPASGNLIHSFAAINRHVSLQFYHLPHQLS